MNDNTNDSKALNPDGTNHLAYLKEPRPSPPETDQRSLKHATVRRSPKGTSIGTANRQKAVFHVKSAIRFWHWIAPIIASILSFFIILPLFTVLGAIIGDDSFLGLFFGMLIGVAATIGLAITAHNHFRPWVKVHVTPDEIIYGDTRYDRKHSSGLVLGYEVKSEGDLKNHFFDQSMGLSALRLTYGRWGEDLPYLVNKYHAAEIVIWMNEIIAAVGAPEPAQHDPAQGRKVEEF